jgi:6,7-dimethyl-8-ribityllumazine synthase
MALFRSENRTTNDRGEHCDVRMLSAPGAADIELAARAKLSSHVAHSSVLTVFGKVATGETALDELDSKHSTAQHCARQPTHTGTVVDNEGHGGVHAHDGRK